MRGLFSPLIFCGLVCAGCQSPGTMQDEAKSAPAQMASAAAPSPKASASCLLDACPTPGASPPSDAPLAVTGEPLEACSQSPMTGWFRDGFCRTDTQDRGVHVVCAQLDEGFLSYTKARGNDLSTPRGSFPGLKPGDRWCLCASRWEQARAAGHAPPVVLEATHERAAKIATLEALQTHAVGAPGSITAP